MTYNIFDVNGNFAFCLPCAQFANDFDRYDYAVTIGKQVLGADFLCAELN